MPRWLAGLTAAALLAMGLLTAPALVPLATTTIAKASAACPDAEVDFARGREEAPGVGAVGQAFINSLQRKAPHKTIGAYGVNYPADVSVTKGSNDMSAHVQSMAATCPNTKLVLGGYSLGAAAADVVVAVDRPGFGFTNPLPPGADQHIAAIALFGNGTSWVGAIKNFNPIYTDRTIDLCHGADPICNPADPHTWQDNWSQHMANGYIQDGEVNQAADFVAGKLA